MYSVELYSRVRRACHVDGMHIPGYPPTYSDNIRPFVPGYPPSFDALP